MTTSMIEDVIFGITYQQHGGSGLNWTRADVLDVAWPTAIATLDRLAKKRTAEASAIKKAQAGST